MLIMQGALYFGVETLLLNCITWFSEVSSSNGFGSLQIQLDDLIYIWKFGLERGELLSDIYLEVLNEQYAVLNMQHACYSLAFEVIMMYPV